MATRRHLPDAPADALCGTYAGWNRHRKLGTAVCDPCREAKNEAHREWRHRTGRSLPRSERLAMQRAARGHGSAAMYGRAKCRCEVCRAWQRGYQSGYRDRKAGRDSQLEGDSDGG